MADVIKCDRCGAIEEPKTISVIRLKRTNEATLCHKWQILSWGSTISYDLCDKCTNALRDWTSKKEVDGDGR